MKLETAEHKAGIGAKTPITPIQSSVQGVSSSEFRILEAAALLRRQAAELMETADRLDPSQAIKAREHLARIRQRVEQEAANQSALRELKKA